MIVNSFIWWIRVHLNSIVLIIFKREFVMWYVLIIIFIFLLSILFNNGLLFILISEFNSVSILLSSDECTVFLSWNFLIYKITIHSEEIMKSKIAPPTDPAITTKVDPLLELLSVEVPVWNYQLHNYIAI